MPHGARSLNKANLNKAILNKAILNKDGQQIGRKGAESRARLLQAARDLMRSMAGETVTASAIARRAGLASQTFYLYFADVQDLLLHLCADVAEDAAALAATLETPWKPDALLEEAEQFVAAFYRYWDRHRPILRVRNFLADNGNAPFDAERNKVSLPIVMGIAAQIAAAHDEALPPQDAMARAVIIFSAIERMAERYSEMADTVALRTDDIKRAEAHILSLLLKPGLTG